MGGLGRGGGAGRRWVDWLCWWGVVGCCVRGKKQKQLGKACPLYAACMHANANTSTQPQHTNMCAHRSNCARSELGPGHPLVLYHKRVIEDARKARARMAKAEEEELCRLMLSSALSEAQVLCPPPTPS